MKPFVIQKGLIALKAWGITFGILVIQALLFPLRNSIVGWGMLGAGCALTLDLGIRILLEWRRRAKQSH